MKSKMKNWMPLILSGIAGLAVAFSISNCSTTTTTTTGYTQIERLARPGINEALVRVNADLNAWNSIAPSLDLTTTATTVVADAAVTLEALYAGVCFTNGALDVITSGTSLELKPAGMTCQAKGLNILNTNAIGLNSAFLTAATTYATTVLGQFAPDVLRLDTALATSAYNGELCNGAAAGSPLLCGGRALDDDAGNSVVNITYSYLLNGGATPSTVSSIRNGAIYNPTANDPTCTTVGGAANSCNAGDSGTPQHNQGQGHSPVNSTMPFSPSAWM